MNIEKIKQMLLEYWDKVALGIAVLIFLITVGVTFLGQTGERIEPFGTLNRRLQDNIDRQMDIGSLTPEIPYAEQIAASYKAKNIDVEDYVVQRGTNVFYPGIRNVVSYSVRVYGVTDVVAKGDLGKVVLQWNINPEQLKAIRDALGVGGSTSMAYGTGYSTGYSVGRQQSLEILRYLKGFRILRRDVSQEDSQWEPLNDDRVIPLKSVITDDTVAVLTGGPYASTQTTSSGIYGPMTSGGMYAGQPSTGRTTEEQPRKRYAFSYIDGNLEVGQQFQYKIQTAVSLETAEYYLNPESESAVTAVATVKSSFLLVVSGVSSDSVTFTVFKNITIRTPDGKNKSKWVRADFSCKRGDKIGYPVLVRFYLSQLAPQPTGGTTGQPRRPSTSRTGTSGTVGTMAGPAGAPGMPGLTGAIGTATGMSSTSRRTGTTGYPGSSTGTGSPSIGGRSGGGSSVPSIGGRTGGTSGPPSIGGGTSRRPSTGTAGTARSAQPGGFPGITPGGVPGIGGIGTGSSMRTQGQRRKIEVYTAREVDFSTRYALVDFSMQYVENPDNVFPFLTKSWNIVYADETGTLYTTTVENVSRFMNNNEIEIEMVDYIGQPSSRGGYPSSTGMPGETSPYAMPGMGMPGTGGYTVPGGGR